MRRSRKPSRRSGCPIGIALDMLGDPWTLLVVRDLMFKGGKTFGEFLSADEGIASNVLADRLCRLEAHGILEKRRDSADARRQIYRLTAKGIDLAPVLVEMVLWSTSYERTAAPSELVQAMRHDKAAFLARLRAGWQSTAARRTAAGTRKRPSSSRDPGRPR